MSIASGLDHEKPPLVLMLVCMCAALRSRKYARSTAGFPGPEENGMRTTLGCTSPVPCDESLLALRRGHDDSGLRLRFSDDHWSDTKP